MRLAGIFVAAALPLACGGRVADGSDPCASGPRVNLLVVLDGSGSMAGDGKWAAATAALDATFDAARGDASSLRSEPSGRADRRLAIGLTIFADVHDARIGAGHAGPYDAIDVPVAPVDGAQDAALHARLDGTVPWLGTPTYEVLSGQYPLLEALGGERALVLITDGVPDPQAPAGVNEQPWSIDIAARERARGVATYVVGIGPLGPLASLSDYDPAFVARLAAAGGTQAIQITPGDAMPNDPLRASLETALASIRTGVAICP